MSSSRVFHEEEFLKAATDLAKTNAEAEPNINEIFLASDQERILLVEIDETAIPNGEYATPFYFDAAPKDGVPLPSGIVMITPEEAENKITLPKEWGEWDQLVSIWKKGT